VGGIYELTGDVETSYYYLAGRRIAMRVTEGVSTTPPTCTATIWAARA